MCAIRSTYAIFARNRAILNKNRAILDQWVKETPEVRYLKPVAGTTALVYYDKDIPSQELCVKLLREKGVLFTPGECFEMEGAVRDVYKRQADHYAISDFVSPAYHGLSQLKTQLRCAKMRKIG